ncbi:MAG TPA: glutathione transferase GstA [Rhizomicrobium sp.]|nr:glutathione transferase GstA [Rhizomicrobium sp.]
MVWNLVDLKSHKTERGEDYFAINPKGYVPALRLGDGSLLTENIAILQYLADKHPQSELAPPPASQERYRLQEWLAYITGEIHKAFAPIFGGADEQGLAKAREKIVKRLHYADKHLEKNSYLMGARFSVADAYFFVMLTWCPKAKIDLSSFARLPAYRDRIAARPAVQAAMKAEGLHTA